MVEAAMGTLAWCVQTEGRLSAKEKEVLAHNVAKLQAESAFDEFRTRLGLLIPGTIDLAALAPPDTALTRDADGFAKSAYDDVLWNHCVRTYYLGALVAAHDGLKFDREIFYAAAVCHDVGANQDNAGPVHTHCFACSGGRLTRDHLLTKGHSDTTALRVGDAISTHMNLFVPVADFPVENALVSVGACCDIMGAYVCRIHPDALSKVVDRYPRAGLMELFGPFLGLMHLPDSRTDVLVKMGAFESHSGSPIEARLAEQALRAPETAHSGAPHQAYRPQL